MPDVYLTNVCDSSIYNAKYLNDNVYNSFADVIVLYHSNFMHNVSEAVNNVSIVYIPGRSLTSDYEVRERYHNVFR